MNAQSPASQPSRLRVSVVCVRLADSVIEVFLGQNLDLPSATPCKEESLEETAERLVHRELGEPAAYVEQLYTFSANINAEREINVSYLALFSPEATDSECWTAFEAASPSDDFDVLSYALTRLRAKLEYTSIGFHLVPAEFTLAELQQAYELILGETLDKRNFRRRMTTGGMLTETGEKRREGPHRPASLYRFSGQADRSSYLTPPNTGANS